MNSDNSMGTPGVQQEYGVLGNNQSTVDPGPKEGANQPNRVRIPAFNQNWFEWSPGVMGMQGYFWNPDGINIETYEKMVKTDETVVSGLEFIILAVISRLGKYTHENQDIEDFVNYNLETMEGTIYQTAAEILSALWAGFSVTEIVWDFDRKMQRVLIGALETLHPDSITFSVGTLYNGPPEMRNRITHIWQWLHTPWQADLPRNKVILYSHRKEFGNFYGTSVLKPAYKNWFIKDQMLKAWAHCMERYATPIAIGTVDEPNAMIMDDQGNSMTNREFMEKLLGQLQSGSAIAKGKDSDITLHQVGRNLGQDFNDMIIYLNKMIYRAMLLPYLVADAGQAGSYALGQTHFDLFTIYLEFLLSDLVSVLIQQLVRPLLEINFGPMGDYGTWQVESFKEDDKQTFSNMVTALVQSGFINSSYLPDVNKVRLRCGFTEWTESDISSLQQAAQGQGAPPQTPQDQNTSEPGEASTNQPGKDLPTSGKSVDSTPGSVVVPPRKPLQMSQRKRSLTSQGPVSLKKALLVQTRS